jgi:hypothetical protein
MSFMLDKFFGVLDRRADVFSSDVVLLTKLVKRHSASQTAKKTCHWNACTSNHGFAVLDFRVNDNSFVHDAGWFDA